MSFEGNRTRPPAGRRASSTQFPAAAGRVLLRGITASPGVATGRAVLFDKLDVPVPRRRIEPAEVDAELSRLSVAMAAARAEIEAARDALDPSLGVEHRLVLDAHLLMHRDELLTSASQANVRSGLNAEWALRRAVESIAARLRGTGERYLAERVRDVEHVGDEILRALSGARTSRPSLSEPSILVAMDLSPAETAHLQRDRVLGIATELGTATSHTAILARALGIPCVVGVEGVTRSVSPGARTVIDALRGEVLVEPDEQATRRADDRARRYAHFQRRLREREAQPGRTSDGTTVALHANVELEVELDEAVGQGIDGVGLYRTEFLYLAGREPSEAEQVELYSRLVSRMAPRSVTLRTFDLGADKMPAGPLPSRSMSRAHNPALGLRGLRLALERRDLFDVQLRAILQAARHGTLRVMFPMVATLDDLRRAKDALASAAAQLTREGMEVGRVQVGAMIEVPSAVAIAGRLAAECDFFSVGTNDLAQYALALDRTDPRVARLVGSLEPAMLALLQQTLASARAAQLEVSICGDLAAHPLAIPLLVGMGFRTLSMSASEIALVREILSLIDVTHCEEVADRALNLGTADEVRRHVIETLGASLGELWDERGVNVGI